MPLLRNAVITLSALFVWVAGSSVAHSQTAGTLLSQEAISAAPEGMVAWRIRYAMKDDNGHITEATGVVVAPANKADGSLRKVIAWTHGTWGTMSKCAPSLSSNFFATTPALDAVKNGYVVVAPDYPGLGTNSPHPYLVGPATARSVLSAVMAARQITQASAGREFAVWGESQGGHAALWTGQLAKTEAPDLTLIAIAAGAPPTDLAANFREASDPNARVFLTALAAESWSRYYDINLDIGKRSTPAIMRKLASNCIQIDKSPRFGALLGILTLRRDLKSVDLPSLQPWASIVAQNSVSSRQSVPVLIAQTENDPLVSPDVTRAFAKRLCAGGTPLRWISLPGKDHVTTARQSADATLEWIEQRFEKTPPPNDCSRF